MKARCKFRVMEVTQVIDYNGGGNDAIKMTAVNSQLSEDVEFTRFTPQGELTFVCQNPKLRGAFKPGNYFYVDITPVEQD